MISLLATAAMLAAMIYVVYHVIVSYQQATSGTAWEKLYAATKDSATLFWGLVVAWVDFGFNSLLNILDSVGAAPEFNAFLTANFTPQIASGIILGVVALLSLARLRGLRKTS